jgi:hypothetical protein
LRARLSLGATELLSLPERSDRFPLPAEADYEVRVERPAVLDGLPAGQYTLQVHWGKADGARCPVPALDHRSCYGPPAAGRMPAGPGGAP